MAKYWEVVESCISWVAYQIPFDVCSDEEQAIALVEQGDATDYIVDQGTDNYQIDSAEPKEE